MNNILHSDEWLCECEFQHRFERNFPIGRPISLVEVAAEVWWTVDKFSGAAGYSRPRRTQQVNDAIVVLNAIRQSQCSCID